MTWERLARSQEGVVARRQLLPLGIDADRVRNQLAARRWVALSPTVIGTTTGPLSPLQLRWLGVLHPSETGLVAGLTGATDQGLTRWDRDEVTVLVSRTAHVAGRIAGVRYASTRRPLTPLRAARRGPPIARIEPAVLLHAASCRSPREAQGLLAASVQQRLSTPERLAGELARLQPIRRARLLRDVLDDIAGGADSLAEVDLVRACDAFGLARPHRQTKRRDRSGRVRRTDAEWDLPDGRTLVLEVEGAAHLEHARWEDDVRRQRALSAPTRIVIRCTAREVRDEPDALMHDLRALGVPRSAP